MGANRAYSLLTIKSIDTELRELEGIASTPEVDRMGDIVDPMGAVFKLPIPLLWQHDPRQPIGEILAATVSPAGILIRAKVARVDVAGRLRDRLDEAWQSLAAGLVKGLSIGFQALEDEPIGGESWGRRFLKWSWLEVSAVTIPANASASITAIKSACTGWPALRLETRAAGVAAIGATRAAGMGAVQEVNFTDQIKAFEGRRAAAVARQSELMSASGARGETLDEAEGAEYDALAGDVKGIDVHLARLREAEAANQAAAKAVSGATAAAAAASRAPAGSSGIVRVVSAPALEPGIGFVRLAVCRGVAFLSQGSTSALDVARARFGDDPRIAMALKAAVPVAAGTTGDPAWAGALVVLQTLEREFIEWLRPQTIIGRIPGLTAVPFNVRAGEMTSGGVANWVGEAKAKPVTSFTFSAQTLGHTKLASIAVLADELVRFSTPNAETLIRTELAKVVRQRMDADFIDPANAGAANVKPASVTNSVAGLPSSGNTAEDVRKDLQTLVLPIVDAGMDPSEVVLVTTPALAMVLGSMTNALGQPEFAGIGPKGGTLGGYTVVVSQLAKFGAPNGSIVAAIHAPSVWLADDGAVTVDASREASLEMSTEPTGDGTTGTGAAQVSLWQNNLLGLRAERTVNWIKVRPAAVQWLKAVAWGS